MGGDRTRVQERRFLPLTLPNGQQVTGQSATGATDAAGQEVLPPLVLGGRLYLGTCSTGIAWNGLRARFGAAGFYAPLGQTPTLPTAGNGQGVNDPGNGLWGLLGPLHRHAVVRGFAWASASGTFGASETRHLLRVDTAGTLYRAAAAGTTAGLVTPAFALGWCNKVVFGQGVADALVTFSIGADGTATYDADRSASFGSTPNGIGAVVEVPGANKALAFGRDLENRNQISATTDGVTYAALPELAISSGTPLRVVDALAIAAAGAAPAVVLVSCLLGGVSGPPRLLRSIDGGATFTLIALDSAAGTAPYLSLQEVNGVLFCWGQSAWYYSIDRGATWIKGGVAAGAGRADWDVARECYILHLRNGTVAVLDRDMSYLGTLTLPAVDQMAVQVSTSSLPTGWVITYAAPGLMPATFYADGALFGVARAVFGTGCYGLFTYRYDLHILRLPKKEGARLEMIGGGGHGDFYFSGGGTIYQFPYAGSDIFRIPATATQALGIAVAAGGVTNSIADNGAGECVQQPTGSGFTKATARGAPGLELDGRILGAGGDRTFEYSGAIGSTGYLIGGNAGSRRTVDVAPGALLVVQIGRGGRLQQRVNGDASGVTSLLVVALSAGQEGGALVTWERWA